jgi:mannobiose 2-epimerase
MNLRACLKIVWEGCFRAGCLVMLVAWPMIALGAEDTLKGQAASFRKQLVEQVMPYWHDRAVDRERGGYVLADDGKGGGNAVDKQLVSQSRMVWGFSHAHLKKLGDGRRDYLAAAEQGYRFLQRHFLDMQHGGYYWKTDLEGKPLVRCKFLYGEAFVIYAFVEYARASGDRAPLREAFSLYRVLQERLHDRDHGGWVEHTEADWTPLRPGDPVNEVEVVGLRSANAHLHWMEALAELYEATKDAEVKRSLEEALQINKEHFYPLDPAKSCFHRHPDWSEVRDPKSAGLSYGHNVEFAWLMIRAEQVLGRAPSWNHFGAHLDHALRVGYDWEHGGLYSRGEGDRPATDRTKVWWAQAEMLAALADGLGRGPNARYREAADKLVRFLVRSQIDAKDGIWYDTVAEDGRLMRAEKAHNWKANYHDVRGLVKFVEGLSAGPNPRRGVGGE